MKGKKTENIWLVGAMAAPLSMTAARSPWLAVTIVSVLSGMICIGINGLLNFRNVQNRTYSALQWLWISLLSGNAAKWTGTFWPDYDRNGILGIVLIAVASWAAWNGKENASRVGKILAGSSIAVLGAVLLSGIRNTKYISQEICAADPMLIVVLLIPVIAGCAGIKTGKAGIWGSVVLGCVISFVSVGVLSGKEAAAVNAPLLELSRSIRLLGLGERFESITAAALTISLFTVLAMLSVCAGEHASVLGETWRKKGIAVSGLISAVVCLSNKVIDWKIACIVSVILWYFGPIIFLKKIKKST